MTLVARVLILCMSGSVIAWTAEKTKAPIPAPDRFVVGRHTYMDFGPPTDYYEVISVRPQSAGSWIERIIVTPPGNPCTQPVPSVEVAGVPSSMSVAELLGGGNPCSIPEKALRRERKRCKKCLVFSGANITMSVQCGTGPRLIRMDILDRDMFDSAPRTPQHTSWTMALLARLDQALGPGVWDRPAFSFEATRREKTAPESSNLTALRNGAFDALFKDAPDKPSDLYLKAQNPPPAPPKVTLVRLSPVRPVKVALPDYPPLARMAGISGIVSFAFDVTPNGAVNHFRFVDGHPLLRPIVENEVTRWRFSAEAEGQSVEGALEFSNPCSVRSQER